MTNPHYALLENQRQEILRGLAALQELDGISALCPFQNALLMEAATLQAKLNKIPKEVEP